MNREEKCIRYFFRFRFAMKFGKLNFIVPVCKKLQELVVCILIKEQWQYSPFFNSCNRLLQGKSKDFETGFQVLFTTQPRLPLSYAGQFPDTPDKGENHDEKHSGHPCGQKAHAH